MPLDPLLVEKTARAFHEAYERLAPTFDYKTRSASAVPWEDVPESNKRLMLAATEAALRVVLTHHAHALDALPWRLPGEQATGVLVSLDEVRAALGLEATTP